MSAKAIEKRPFRLRNPILDFFCPLCRTKRSLIYGSKLQKKHYIQIAVSSLFMMVATFHWMSGRVFLWPLIVWAFFEAFHKYLFRREIPCPHCGFDATWYKRDVKMANKLVKEFWQEKATPKS